MSRQVAKSSARMVTNLAEYAEINPTAGALDRNSAELVAFVPMAAVSEDGRLTGTEMRPIADVAKGYTYFERNDVLMAKITPCMENGKAALLDSLETERGFGSTEFHVLRPRPGVDRRFLFYLVWNRRFRDEAAKHMTGSAGQKRVPSAYLKEAKVRWVAPDEQRRIADVLDKADAIRRKRKHAITLAADLLRSAFLEMFGDPLTNPKGWVTQPLGAVAAVNRGRFSPRPRNDPSFYNGRYPFLQTGDITAAPYYLTAWNQTLNDAGIRVSRSFPPGAVLVAIVGATIGETAVLSFESYCPDSVVGIVPSPPYTGEFLEYSLRFWKQRFRDEAPETARANINLETLRPVPIPVVAPDSIRRFSSIYRTVAKLAGETMAADYDRLFDSLIDRSFGSAAAGTTSRWPGSDRSSDPTVSI